MAWAESVVGFPERFEFEFEVDLAAEAEEETVVPLVGFEVLSDGGEVESGDVDV